jgi:hypothetical protein
MSLAEAAELVEDGARIVIQSELVASSSHSG